MTTKLTAHPTPGRAPADHTPVRSCHVTPDMLRSWGFEVRGEVVTHDEWRQGIEFGTARHLSRVLGWCFDSHWEEHERTWVGTCKVTDEQRARGQELVAWFHNTPGRFTRTGEPTQHRFTEAHA